MRLIKSMRRYCTTLLAESIPYPLDARRFAFDQQRVEAALRQIAQPRKIMTRGPQELCSLGRGDARSGAAEGQRSAPPHFDENSRAAVARDEIDLTQPAAVVARDDRQSPALEEG